MSGRDGEEVYEPRERESELPILDFFSDVNTIVKEQVLPVVKDIRDEIKNISPEANIENLTIEEHKSEWQAISFSARTDKASSQGPGRSEVVREMPFDGHVREVIVGFPDGSDEWVGIRLENTNTADKVFPSNPETDLFAANDYYDDFKVTYPVEKGDELTVVHENYDDQETRLVNCFIQLEAEA